MNEMLITNWNRKVGNEDEVYIIGDLAYRSSRPVKGYLDRIALWDQGKRPIEEIDLLGAKAAALTHGHPLGD